MTAFPASYGKEVLAVIKDMLPEGKHRILDPFAGPNGVRRLKEVIGIQHAYLGLELEEEWADAGLDTYVGDALVLLDNPQVKEFEPDCVITSPPYANRMADQYLGDARNSTRHTYAISLGRKLTGGSVAAMQWGTNYQRTMSAAFFQIHEILPRRGIFILNMGDHIRKGQKIHVSHWALEQCMRTGFGMTRWRSVDVPKLGHGANADVRIDEEHVFLMQKL